MTGSPLGGEARGSEGDPAGRSVRRLRRLAVGTLVLTFALLALGSTVRVTSSGMGCPSWPLCFGRVGPIFRFHTILEQLHRYLAAMVSVGVLAVALQAWRLRPHRAVRPALYAVPILALQVVLGGITVLAHNAPVTVSLHLAGALLLLAVITVTVVASRVDSRAVEQPRRPAGLALSAVVGTFVLLVSGSIVTDGGASAACPSWPWCAPRKGVSDSLVAIALIHRGVALVAVGLIVALAVGVLLRRRGAKPGVVALGWSLLGLCAAQVASGAVTAVLSAPAAAQDVHLAGAAAIWVCVVALVALVSYAGDQLEIAPGHPPVSVGAPAGIGLIGAGGRGASSAPASPSSPFVARERRRVVSPARVGAVTRDLRRVGLVSVMVLLVQFVLGVAANLWVTIDTERPWSHIGNLALFGAHAVIGVAIALLAFVVVGLAFEEGSRTTKTWAMVALFGVLAALGCGFAFVETGGQSGYSFGMALGWALALLANVCLALGPSDSIADIPPWRVDEPPSPALHHPRC